MKMTLTLVLGLGLLIPLLAGCGLEAEPGAANEEPQATVSLCGGCGQFKGSEACCADEAALCSGCQLAKGSPGCCKMPK